MLCVVLYGGLPLEARPRFEIVDSKVWASGISQFPPQWADLHTVLFHTGPEFRVRDADWSLAIWDVRGKPRIYRPNVHAYCVRDGFIVYFVPEDVRGIRGTWYAGKLGEEKPIRQDSEEDTARLYDPINCKVAAVKELRERAAKTNRAIVWLLDGHGFLDLGALLGPESMLNTPVRYFRADARAASAVTLPFGRREIRRLPSEYYPFQDSYVIQSVYFDPVRGGGVSPWPRHIDQPVWIMNSEGVVTKKTLPRGPWTGMSDPFVDLSAAGLLITYTSGIRQGTTGLYLFDGHSLKHLLAGQVGQVGVSRDGCSIAFSHSPSTGQGDLLISVDKRTFKVIHLCGKGKP